MKKFFTTKHIIFAGLLISMEILFSRFLQIPIPFFEISKDRISLGFIPVAIGGMLYGPAGGGMIAGVSDIIRAIVLPQGGAINPFFTGTAILRGVLYGLFLHKSINQSRTVIVSSIILVGVNLLLNSAITAFSYGGTFAARFVTKLIPAIVNYIIQLAVLIPLLPRLERSLSKNA